MRSHPAITTREPGGNGTSRDSLFNDPNYFGVGSSYADQPTIRGFFQADTTDNSYHTFNAGGQDFLVVTTEWAPRDEVLTWTGDVIAAHPRHRAILLTHAYLGDEDNGRYDWDIRGSRQHWSPRDTSIYGTDLTSTANDGEDIWDELVRHHINLGMVIAGHSSTSTGGNLSAKPG